MPSYSAFQFRHIPPALLTYITTLLLLLLTAYSTVQLPISITDKFTARKSSLGKKTMAFSALGNAHY